MSDVTLEFGITTDSASRELLKLIGQIHRSLSGLDRMMADAGKSSGAALVSGVEPSFKEFHRRARQALQNAGTEAGKTFVDAAGKEIDGVAAKLDQTYRKSREVLEQISRLDVKFDNSSYEKRLSILRQINGELAKGTGEGNLRSHYGNSAVDAALSATNSNIERLKANLSTLKALPENFRTLTVRANESAEAVSRAYAALERVQGNIAGVKALPENFRTLTVRANESAESMRAAYAQLERISSNIAASRNLRESAEGFRLLSANARLAAVSVQDYVLAAARMGNVQGVGGIKALTQAGSSSNTLAEMRAYYKAQEGFQYPTAGASTTDLLKQRVKEAGDEFRKANPYIKETGERVNNVGSATRELHSAMRGLTGAFGATWLTWGSTIPLATFAALGASLRQAIKLGSELEYQLTFVKALSGESQAAVGRMQALVYEQAQNGLYGPTELANGLRILSQAGLTASESMSALSSTTQLATVGEMSMKDAAITLVGVMNAFSLTVADIPHVGDVFAKAAAVSQTSVEQMTQAMRMASVAGEMYGATMEDTATALTLLAKVNITGTAAGTSFRNMLKEIYTPSQQAADAWKRIGVSATDAGGSVRSFSDVLYDLKSKLAEYSRPDQMNILQRLFGERGSKEAIAMLSQTRDEWDKLQQTISSSSGFMARVSEELEATSKGTLKQAFNTLEVSLVKAFETTEGSVQSLAASMKELFGSQQFVETVKSVVGWMVNLAKVVVDLSGALLAGAVAWGAWKVAALAGVAALGPIGLGVAALTFTLSSLWLAMKGSEASSAADAVQNNAQRTIDALRNEAGAAEGALVALRNLNAEKLKGGSSNQSSGTPADSIEKELDALLKRRVHRNFISQGFAAVGGLFGQPFEDQIALKQRQLKEAREQEARAAAANSELNRERSIASGIDVNLKGLIDSNDSAVNLVTKKWSDPAKGGSSTKLSAEALLAKKEVESLSASYTQFERVSKSALSFEKHKADLAVKYGEMSQDAAAMVFAVKEQAANQVLLVEGEAKELAIKQQIATLNKTRDANTITELNTKLGSLQASNALLRTENTRKAVLMDLEAQYRRQKELREAEAAMAKVSLETDLMIDKKRLEVNRQLMDPGALAYEEGKLQVTQKYAAELQKMELSIEHHTDLWDKAADAYAAATDPATAEGFRKEMEGEAKQVEHLTELFKKFGLRVETEAERAGAAFRKLSDEQQTFGFGMSKALNDLFNKSGNAAKDAETIFNTAFKGMEDMIFDWLDTGKWSSKKFVDAMEQELKRLAARKIVVEIVGSISGLVAAGGSALLSLLGGGGSSGSGSSLGTLSSALNAASSASTLWAFGQGLLTGSGTGMAGTVGAAINGAYTAGSVGGVAGLSAYGSIASGTTYGTGLLSQQSLMLAAQEAPLLGLSAGAGGGAAASGAAGGGAAAAGGASWLPYVGWAIAAASLIYALTGGGGTPHRGAVAFGSETGFTNPKTTSDLQSMYANPSDYDQFGGSDFTKRYTASIGNALGPVAQGMAQTFNNITRKYGAGEGYQVGLGFSADNDSKSRGRFSIIDSKGNEITDFMGRYNKKTGKGMEQFFTAAQGGLLEGLAKLNLGPTINKYLGSAGSALRSMTKEQTTTILGLMANGKIEKLLDVMQGVGMGFTDITNKLVTLVPVLGAVDRVSDEFAKAIILFKGSGEDLVKFSDAMVTLSEALNTDPFEAYAKTASEQNNLLLQMGRKAADLRTMSKAFDGTVTAAQALATVTQERYQIELQLAQQLADAVKTTSTMFEDSIRSVKLDVLDAPGKYDFYDKESARYRDVLMTLTDPAMIQEYAGRLNSNIMAAWGVLTDEQKKDTSDKFVKLLEDSDQLALSRYAAVKETTKSDNEQLKADIAAAVSAAVSKIAAAASIPQKVEVSVAIPGIASVSEVVAY